MKIKTDFITHTIEDTQILVCVSRDSFNGIARSNQTAAFIVDCLREDTTKEQIVEAMCARYDAPRDTISDDVEKILNKLRSINALEE